LTILVRLPVDLLVTIAVKRHRIKTKIAHFLYLTYVNIHMEEVLKFEIMIRECIQIFPD